MTRYWIGLVVCVCASAPSAQVTSRPDTPAARIAAAEAEGAPRKCTIVKPEQIGLPTSRGNPADFYLESGDFSAGSITFGWDATYVQAKMPLAPRHPDAIGGGLTMNVTRIDPPGETLQLKVASFPLNASFFPTWPRFPTPGTWMIVATAGVNWGCFVLDRPVKPSG